ncbi:MAG: HNH endonuclease [Pseudonocardia sp.]
MPDGLRRAVAARDRGCARCARPPSLCEFHHLVPWEHGGTTDLANLAMLCRSCHVRHEALSVPNGGGRAPSATCRSGSLKLRAA